MTTREPPLLRLQRIADSIPESPPFHCPKHGTQPTNPTTYPENTSCWQCDHEEARAAVERDRRARRIEAFHIALDRELGERHRGATLAGFAASTPQQRAAVDACRAFAEQQGGAGLILIGPPGTGKTTLAAATCRARIDAQAQSAGVTTQRELIRRIRATWRKGAEETEDEVLAELTGAGVLVLDDAGIGYGTEAEATQLLDVIDGRYRRCRPTVVCSNLPALQLRPALGDRIFDRLREGARYLVCDWPSFRGGRGDA